MEPMIASLLRPQAYGHPVHSLQLRQTHLSWILLTGDFAYKIKKPVDLGFVDFSTAAKREFFCREELRLNQRLSPDLYLDLCVIHGPPEQACFHGDGPPIEMALRMRQFRQEDLLVAVLRHSPPPAAHLQAPMMELAERLARFHAQAPPAPEGSDHGWPAQVLAPALANLLALRQRLGEDPRLLPLQAWCQTEGQRLEPLFARRRREGCVRECHGDLHLGNLVRHQEHLLPFDCLEFSPALRWIDVISDLAFLAMDLCRQRHELLAMLLLNRWLELSGDYGGLALWRWYWAYRALVRAKVSVLQLDDSERSAHERRGLRADLRAYLLLAEGVRHPRRPLLLITHGVSGSGKSHLARRLCRQLGWLQIRSDLERLRLFGRWGEPRAPARSGDPYASAVTDELYGERLTACCAAALEAGLSVICDATFLLRRQRRQFERLAERLGARFAILVCPCPPDLARRRILERGRGPWDPSEADGTVLQVQLRQIEELDAAEQRLAVSLSAQAADGAELPQREIDSLLRQLKCIGS